MATRKARRETNKAGTIYCVKTGFKKIFTEARLAAITLQAVQLVTPILIASNALANLHVLRCLEADCMYAVTHATGNRAVHFNALKNSSLAASYSLYSQQLPASHQTLERPTYIKDVSVATAHLVCNVYLDVPTNYIVYIACTAYVKT